MLTAEIATFASTENITSAVKLTAERWDRSCFFRSRVMVFSPSTGFRKLTLYSDGGGLYVRMGKRREAKVYLYDMGKAKITNDFDLPVFYE